MKKQNKPTFQKICILSGIFLLTAACAILFLWQWNIHACRQQAQDYVHTLRSLMPEVQNVALEERRDNSMPVLPLDGIDFIGILEIPLYDSTLPVCADWGNPSQYPRCLSGSIYDRSIQIGATSQTGQYDFYRKLSVGDSVFFTDIFYIWNILTNDKDYRLISALLSIISTIILTSLISSYGNRNTPTAMDVYQGKTTLEYKVVEGVKVDSIVIFKNDDYGK